MVALQGRDAQLRGRRAYPRIVGRMELPPSHILDFGGKKFGGEGTVLEIIDQILEKWSLKCNEGRFWGLLESFSGYPS